MYLKSRRIMFSLLLLMTMFLVAINNSLVLAVPAAPADPGGIGTANLVAWFDAGVDTFSDTDCLTIAVAADPVACWKDQSPNILEATQGGVGKRPTLQSAHLNNLPVVRFDGSNDVLGTGDDSIDALDPAFPTADATVFMVQKTSAVQVQSSLAVSPTVSTNRFDTRIPWSDNAVYWDMGDGSSTGNGHLSYSPFADTSSFYLWGFEMDSGTGQKIYQNGETKASDGTADTFAPTDTALFIGATDNDNGSFSGDFAELIIYNNTLTDLERTHVELYLRDKYELDLSDSGIYTAPLTYNHNVRGISLRAQVYNSDLPVQSAGLRVNDFSFLQDADDALVFGHNNAPFACCVEGPDLTDSAANRRWARLWSFNINDAPTTAGGWIDLTFDISEAGGQGVFDNGGAYYLLKRATNSSENFSDVPLVSTTIAGDRITFRVLVTYLNSEFTLGAFESPLAVGLNSFDGSSSAASKILLAVFALLLLFTLVALVQRKKEAN